MRRTVPVVMAALLATACAADPQPRSGGPDTRPPAAPLSFVLEPFYSAGETVAVKLRNQGPRTYLYNQEYAACDITYTDERGREFLIPPGTHCDLVVMVPIRPGETKTLFEWSLDECVKDEWGCTESRQLTPGYYTLAGSFEPEGGGPPARAEATIQITGR